MSIPRTEARAITPRPIEPDETKAAAGGATKTKTSPLPPKGTQTLVDAAGKGRGSNLAAFAAADTGRARVEAARSAVGELARASGQDADAFAARYLNKDFDGAATHAALSVALAGVGYAVGSVPGVHHAVDAAGKATAARVAPVLGQAAAEGAKEVVHIGVHAGSEGLAARAYGAARH
jgi:hypothetical protein